MTLSSEFPVRMTTDSNTATMMELPTFATDRRVRGGTALNCEESLIVDDRSALSPAQAVENRLSRLLSDASMPISHLQMRGMLTRRS